MGDPLSKLKFTNRLFSFMMGFVDQYLAFPRSCFPGVNLIIEIFTGRSSPYSETVRSLVNERMVEMKKRFFLNIRLPG